MGGAKAFDAHTQVKTQGWGKRGERAILSLIKTFFFMDVVISDGNTKIHPRTFRKIILYCLYKKKRCHNL